MENQKLDEQLQLALSVDSTLREDSGNLNTGFSPQTQTWELIVKYNGDLQRLAGDVIQIEDLIAGYSIITIPENRIEAFAQLEEVEYIEKPKRLFPQVLTGLRDSCFYPVLYEQAIDGVNLSGQGVYLAVIDSGIDYTLDIFRNSDGTTKIAYLWDQGKVADPEKGERPPDGFTIGVEYTSEQINQNMDTTPSISTDVTGHGTAVTAVAIQGAPGCRLIIVRLDTSNQMSYPMTTNLMRAFTYVIRKSLAENIPVSINLSYGNTYGPHDGTSLLERFLDNVSEIGRNVICVGAGNEGASAGHFIGNINQTQLIEFAMGNYEQSFSLQLWKIPTDIFNVEIVSPGGERYQVPLGGQEGASSQTVLEQTRLLVQAGRAQPYRIKEEIYIDFLPLDLYINTGIWQIVLTPIDIKNGNFQLYMPSEVIRSSATRFLLPNPLATLTVPSTAEKIITVGAYNAYYNAYADFSGRGFVVNSSTITEGLNKPDLVAPGVDILVPGRFGDERVSGTSYATPFVTAAAALLMEWGIIMRNDPFLYGEKVKAYLINGARRLPGYNEWPNQQVGWGALCVYDSIPR